jgi:hypothetical protein
VYKGLDAGRVSTSHYILSPIQATGLGLSISVYCVDIDLHFFGESYLLKEESTFEPEGAAYLGGIISPWMRQIVDVIDVPFN